MFTLVDTTSFPSWRIVAKRYRHACGMEVLSLEAPDPENLFCLCFSTEAGDDTGVAHIVEHSVLEGSRRFPVKDPFVCLLKTSVATFLNACTYPDRTLYPFITCCPRDYYNLLEVYWDAVFHPLLTRETLGQEGWHYELHGKGDQKILSQNGIVHNEMSGYYSQPNTLLGRLTEKSLFPHTSLRYDSGGVPERIPTLTYSRFLQFHHRHYHPSVAKVVLYGNLPTEEKLAVLERHLERELPQMPPPPPAPPARPAPPRKDAPQVRRSRFVPDPAARKNGTGLVSLSWALDESRDMSLDLLFQLLDAVLLGNSAAPLSKALMESGLGTTPLPSGYDNETLYTSFSVGMQGVKPKDFPRFEALVFSVLEDCVKKGFSPELVRGALTRFQMKNQTIGREFVYELLEDVMASWQYGDDPYLFLRQTQQLPGLQERLLQEPRCLENLVEKWLLRNPRRVRVELRPDAGLKERQDERLRRKMARRLSTWTPGKIREVQEFQGALQKKALQEDSPEALATIPVLKRTDLPERPTDLLYEDVSFSSGMPVRRSRDFTNGISALHLTLDASSLPPELLLPLQIFVRLLPRLGTSQYTYDQFSQMWGELGAVVSLSPNLSTSLRAPQPARFTLDLTLTALDSLFPQAADLFRLSVQDPSFRERKRIREVLRAEAGAASAALLKRRNFSMASAIAMDGISPRASFLARTSGPQDYQLLQSLAKLPEAQLDALVEQMETLARWMQGIPVVMAGVATEDKTAWRTMEELTALWPLAARGAAPADALLASVHRPRPMGRREYGLLPTKVHTNLRAFPAPHESEADYIPLLLGCNLLTTGYLWDQIRAKGGAYGCSLLCRPPVTLLYAHDDPHCPETYQVFQGLRRHLRENPFTSQDVDRAILQTLGPYLTPRRPAEAAGLCLSTLRRESTNETRAQFFDKVQRTTAREVNQALDALLQTGGNDCALGPAPAPKDFTPFPLPL
ncbi:MAG: insulinase family protein [Oligosphaeraceae bacterium]